MEQDKNIMPHIKIIDVGNWIATHLSFLPSVPLSRGDSLINRGGGPMLDAQLDEPDDGFAPGELTQERLFRVDL